MRVVAAALLGLTVAGLAAPGVSRAQGLNEIGRQLQEQVLGGRPNQDAERRAYEQGRRDQEDARRRDEDRRQSYDERRRDDDRRRQADDRARNQREVDRANRTWADDQRNRLPPGRY